MSSRLHFEVFIRELRVLASESGRKQLTLNGMRTEGDEDVGSVRLSQIEAAMKETRADRADE